MVDIGVVDCGVRRVESVFAVWAEKGRDQGFVNLRDVLLDILVVWVDFGPLF